MSFLAEDLHRCSALGSRQLHIRVSPKHQAGVAGEAEELILKPKYRKKTAFQRFYRIFIKAHHFKKLTNKNNYSSGPNTSFRSCSLSSSFRRRPQKRERGEPRRREPRETGQAEAPRRCHSRRCQRSTTNDMKTATADFPRGTIRTPVTGRCTVCFRPF